MASTRIPKAELSAEAMTQTPTAVTDELSARLLKALGAPALVELTAYIALATTIPATTPRPASRHRGSPSPVV